MSLEMDDIVITGVGVWSCFGRGKKILLSALKDNMNGFNNTEKLDLEDDWFACKGSMEINPNNQKLKYHDKQYDIQDWPIHLGVETAMDAWNDSNAIGYYDKNKIGVFNGTSHGANHGMVTYIQDYINNNELDHILMSKSSSWIARQIAYKTHAFGYNYTFNTACSSGINSIGIASKFIRSGAIDCAIAGATDTFSLISYCGFSSLRALDPLGCKPFDKERKGLSLGDGAAFCILEKESAAIKRGARIYAKIGGYACRADGYHPTAPDPSGKGAFIVMKEALEPINNPENLKYISAHGTGTVANDEAEIKAIQKLIKKFSLNNVYVSSQKSQVGHTLGSAGAIQIVSTILSMNNNIIPGTVTLVNPIDTDTKIKLPSNSISKEYDTAIVNSFGFGGSVTSMCLTS